MEPELCSCLSPPRDIALLKKKRRLVEKSAGAKRHCPVEKSAVAKKSLKRQTNAELASGNTAPSCHNHPQGLTARIPSPDSTTGFTLHGCLPCSRRLSGRRYNRKTMSPSSGNVSPERAGRQPTAIACKNTKVLHQEGVFLPMRTLGIFVVKCIKSNQLLCNNRSIRWRSAGQFRTDAACRAV